MAPPTKPAGSCTGCGRTSTGLDYSREMDNGKTAVSVPPSVELHALGTRRKVRSR